MSGFNEFPRFKALTQRISAYKLQHQISARVNALALVLL